jgi:hypothetical protein
MIFKKMNCFKLENEFKKKKRKKKCLNGVFESQKKMREKKVKGKKVKEGSKRKLK